MNQKKKRQYKWLPKTRAVLLGLCLVAGVGGVFAYAAGDTTSADERKLQNGSFEEPGGEPEQLLQNLVPAWNTTAFEEKIELFKKNTNSYIRNVTLTPTDGEFAAELNADEESTLYQNVKTTPSSIYEWGLDHGARNTADTMALVIGPKQSVDPSKPSKAGRDQLMQMIDWLIANGSTKVKDENQTGLGEQLTVYSKKFAGNGTFQDNAGNNAFSLTPSSIYTEEWHIWIMADKKATSGENPWGRYGSNATGSAGSTDGSGNTDIDKSKYYLYTVPSGQTETLFGFVSVGVKGTTNKTLGNFLDNINFELYHPLSVSTTTHGSVVIGSSESTGKTVTSETELSTYVTDGKTLQLTATPEEQCEFAGVYYTTQDAKGEPVVTFLQASEWTPADDGSYTYSLENIKSATDLHFVFVKSPTVTYDSNGGKPYVVKRTHNTTEADNVYSFKPVTKDDESLQFIDPYVSGEAKGQNDGWKFMGWKLTGDTIDDTAVDLLPGVHTIACDYSVKNASEREASQNFKIFSGDVTLSKTENDQTGVKWTGTDVPIYEKTHKGLTLVAQWRWRQAFVPQIKTVDNKYKNAATGGTVEITSVTNKLDENYNAEYNNDGGKSYHAATSENVTVEAKPNDNFTFEGWYDEKGNLITTKATYTYTETKEGINTYYARFSGSITQKYIRQIKTGEKWKDTDDDNIGILGRYEYTDAPGNVVSSTAAEGNGYKFVGWYDEEGNEVTGDNMLTNSGKTLSYTTSTNATYYARFEKMYTVKFVAQTKQSDGSFKDGTDGGTVSVSTVTDVSGATASSIAEAKNSYKFVGWYDAKGNLLSEENTYTPKITSEPDNVTYYARFEITSTATVEENVLLSFIAESAETEIPDAFSGKNAGTGINATGYGLDSKYGNTIATGFKYSVDNTTDVKTIQITVKVPETAYVKVGGTSNFSGKGTAILTDNDGVQYNKGSIQQISSATTLTYYWDATGLTSGATYGFIIDNLYAPGATATITVNGTEGTKVTDENGVVNTDSASYQTKSHYAK